MFPDNIKFLFFLSIALFCCRPVSAQTSQVAFGKSRIQYKLYDWKILSTSNFDVYFHGDNQELASVAAKYAEDNYAKITERIGYAPFNKSKIILYNSVNDQQQSNIELDADNYMVGGQTHFVKSRVEVAFKGSHAQLKNDVVEGVSLTIINLMLFGGSLKDVVQNTYMMSMPEWFLKGSAAYISKGWDREMDNHLRDMALKKKLKNPIAYSGKDAEMVGQSVFNYIAFKYGKSNIPSIFSLTRIIRNEESSIESILGVPYYAFLREWREFYSQSAKELEHEYSFADSKNVVKSETKNITDINNLTFSPDRNHLAYTIQKDGKYKIMLMDLETKKAQVLKRGGHRLFDRPANTMVPQIAWQNSQVITFIDFQRGKQTLHILDIKSRKSSSKELAQFSQVFSYRYSDDGKLMVMSAEKNGQSDIYIFDVQRNLYSQVTNDLFDDLDPVFLKGSHKVLFSSNRDQDTTLAITESKNTLYRKFNDNFHIYSYDPAKKTEIVRISKDGSNTNPQVLDRETVLFLGDNKGVQNVYQYNLVTGALKQSTAFMQDIKEFSVHELGGFAFISLEKGKKKLFLYEKYDFNQSFNPVYTYRNQMLFPVSQKIVQLKPEDFYLDSDNDTGSDESKKEAEIDIHNYHFESDKKVSKKVNVFFDSKKEPGKIDLLSKAPVNVFGPYPYKNFYSIDRVTFTPVFDNLRGFGFYAQSTMSDVLNNHRLTMGLFGTDFRNSNLNAEYQYLKHRQNYKIRFDRSTFGVFGSTFFYRFTSNRFAGTIAHPISPKARIGITPFVVHTRFIDYENFNPDQASIFGGGRVEYVFDNTRLYGLNMPEGTRVMAFLENYMNAGSSARGFNKFVVDFRHYKRLHKELTFATRFSYGRFFGNSPKFFMLGGLDNWIFSNTNTEGSDNPMGNIMDRDKDDYFFMAFATNMRGHAFNQQWGEQYFLINNELRWPIAQYFSRGVINSSFLKNLQLVGFTDIGSAWTGKGVFSQENNKNTTNTPLDGSYFSATVTNYKSPFLIGYGIGARTMLMGYYVKLDVAWGIAEEVRQPRTYHLTLGFDF